MSKNRKNYLLLSKIKSLICKINKLIEKVFIRLTKTFTSHLLLLYEIYFNYNWLNVLVICNCLKFFLYNLVFFICVIYWNHMNAIWKKSSFKVRWLSSKPKNKTCVKKKSGWFFLSALKHRSIVWLNWGHPPPPISPERNKSMLKNQFWRQQKSFNQKAHHSVLPSNHLWVSSTLL